MFVGVFTLLTGAYFAWTATPGFKELVARPVLGWNAQATAFVLRVLGEDAQAGGMRLASPRYVMGIARGCDGLDPLALMLAATVAFPTTARRRVAAIAVGTVGIAAFNLFRLVTLYYIGVHWPSAFETFHVEVWQPVFAVVVLASWLGWAWWATAPKAGARDVAAE